MSFAQVRLQAQRFDRLRAGLLFACFRRFEPMINLTCRGGESRVCEGKVGVECDRLLEKLGRGPKILQEVIGPCLVFAALEIENISVGVVRWFCFDAHFFLWRKRCSKGVSNPLRHFTFHTKNIDQFAIVTLRP